MFLQRSAASLARRTIARPSTVTRTFTSSIVRREAPKDTTKGPAEAPVNSEQLFKSLSEIKTEKDLLPPGAEPGTVPTDLEQSTGLERLEILGKMAGIDIFDMKPLPSDRLGTLDNPIIVKSFGDEQHCGCTGCPADSHEVIWITITREEPLERCPECGSCYQMEYVGPQHDPHHDDHHGHHEVNPYAIKPKDMADFIKPEYRWR